MSKKKGLHVGYTVSTPAVLNAVPYEEIEECLKRHESGDWGEVSAEDKKENDKSARRENYALSAYLSKNGTRFWIITDQTVTTVLLPDDY